MRQNSSVASKKIRRGNDMHFTKPAPAGNRGGKTFTKSQRLDANFIKSSISPLNFYRFELPDAPIKKHGWNNGGLCPFHADKNPGSFQVNTETGAFKCFSCGIKGGDIIAFTMALHDLGFCDALIKLADDWGLS
jgi:DNA primase